MRISVRIFIGYALILVLFGIVTFVNRRLSQQVIENSEWLTRSEIIIRNTSRLQRTAIDLENGFRGFLLTGNNVFLEPYLMGRPEIPGLFTEVRLQVGNNPRQEKALDTIQSLLIRWIETFADPLIESKKNAEFSPKSEHLYNYLFEKELKNQVGKQVTDQMRKKFKQFMDYEYKLREKRRENLNRSIVYTGSTSFSIIILSIILSLLSAVYITRIILRRIRKMVGLAEKISNGNFNISIDDNSHDELSNLSESLNKMAKTLNESFTDLELKNAELDQFAYVVSHDLKAPLRGMDNVMKWIQEDVGEKVDPQVKEYLQMIKGRVRRMENLINGILQFSRIGRTSRPKEKFNVKDLVQEVIELVSAPPTFNFHIAPGLPELYTEKVYLQQVFSNLISNAVKYHNRPDGNVWIGVEDVGDKYRFYVQDDGPGVEPEYHEKIFKIFQTLQERDAVESTGVGLAIVKKIIADKGCDIKIESKEGNGARFVFTWPKVESPPNEQI